jgi:hypothetical protein
MWGDKHMEKIKKLFDPKKDIYRTIEKVITYDESAEISKYVVTESIEEQFEKLLSRMQIAMEEGGENEVGVWVSGFYGSGKSSFTKYLGLKLRIKFTLNYLKRQVLLLLKPLILLNLRMSVSKKCWILFVMQQVRSILFLFDNSPQCY